MPALSDTTIKELYHCVRTLDKRLSNSITIYCNLINAAHESDIQCQHEMNINIFINNSLFAILCVDL